VTGKIFVIGLGPGNADQITPQATRAAAEAEFFFGYGPYVDRLELRPDQTRIGQGGAGESG
jgi:precorrin-3B C17-methyltransferase